MEQLSALLLTLLIEVPLAVLLAHRWSSPRGRMAVCAAAASLITHAPAWALIRGLQSACPPFWARAVPVELALTVLEALLYWRLVPLSARQGLGVAALANAASFGVGLLGPVQRLLGQP